MRRAATLAGAAIALGLGFGWWRLRAAYDSAMFAPHPEDRVLMARLLDGRFGGKVRLISVPYVDRDVNGMVGVIETAPGFVPVDVHEEGQAIVFERDRGRRIAITAMRPWEIGRTRDGYLRQR